MPYDMVHLREVVPVNPFGKTHLAIIWLACLTSAFLIQFPVAMHFYIRDYIQKRIISPPTTLEKSFWHLAIFSYKLWPLAIIIAAATLAMSIIYIVGTLRTHKSIPQVILASVAMVLCVSSFLSVVWVKTRSYEILFQH